MEKRFIFIPVALAFIVSAIMVMPAAAVKGQTQDHSGHIGLKIHESTVKGYDIAYHLVDLPGRIDKHLMAYVVDQQGNAVTKARVGFLLRGPDGREQKVMAMAMKDSFGGDIDLTSQGSYLVIAKVVHGGQVLLDNFRYMVK